MTDSYACREDFKQVADQLCEATQAIDAIDFNSVATPEDLRAILDAQETLREICLHHRHNQRGLTHRQRNGTADTGDNSHE